MINAEVLQLGEISCFDFHSGVGHFGLGKYKMQDFQSGVFPLRKNPTKEYFRIL